MDGPVEFMFEKGRVDSFKGKWKPLRGFKHCTPARFAAAGFHYVGSRSVPDNVKCFACQIELGDWEKDDDPWEEHKKRGEHCKFVQIKSKSEVTVRDLIELYFEIKKNEAIGLYEDNKNVLEKNRDELRKMYTQLKKKK